ncbi:unnamed protein product [Rotaria socialis]
MFQTTTTAHAVELEVCVQPEGYEHMYLVYEPHKTRIDEIKTMIFKENRYKFQAFFRGQYLGSGCHVPDGTSPEEPIILKLIMRRDTTQTHDDDVTGQNMLIDPPDESRTRAMFNNRQVVSKFNKCMNRSQSNLHTDDRDLADNASSSRDNLLSTDNNPSDGWTFNSLIWQAASSLWHRITNGNITSPFKMVTYVQINIFLTLNDFVFNLLIIIKCINEENFQKLLIELCI